MAKKKTVRKRYTEKEKEKILLFVEEINSSKGRGGPAAAKKKFGISPITLSAWQKKRGSAQIHSHKSGAAKSSFIRMASILDEIEAAEKKILALRTEYEKLRKKI